MHYCPFRFEDYPNTNKALEVFPVDFSTMMAVKNIRYKDGTIAFTRVLKLETIESTFDLSGDEADFSAYAEPELRALRCCLKQVEDYDRNDVGLAQQTLRTQFEISNQFRFFHQSLGGVRYVRLCRDLIDKNMGEALHPYMYPDLILSVFTGYNKNSNHDLEGLFEGVKDFINSVDLDTDTVEVVLSGIGSKCSEAAYVRWSDICLGDEALAPVMRRLILKGLLPTRYDPRKVYPRISLATLLSFPKEDICTLLREVPGGMKNTTRQIFQSFGKTCDPDYVEAYLENPAKDLSFITNSAFIGSLPPDLQAKVLQGKIFDSSATRLEIIHYYKSVLDDENAKNQTIQACENYGKHDLAKAFRGEDFSLTGLSLKEIIELFPLVDFSRPIMTGRLLAFIRRDAGLMYQHDLAEEFFRLLEADAYRDIVDYGLTEGLIRNPALKLRLADVHHKIQDLGLKEWRYHD